MSDEHPPLPGLPETPHDADGGASAAERPAEDPGPEHEEALGSTDDSETPESADASETLGSEDESEAHGSTEESEPRAPAAGVDAADDDDAETPRTADAETAPTSDDEPRGTDRGTVKWYSLAKGYGFLLDEAGGPDIFVHHSALKEAGESEPLIEGEKVEFQLEDTPRGRRARHVRRI